ncbi:MAG: hypothetical protein EZS28_027675 [Streblomastix strix]|uniref:Uncharacterized protein n=1 Tax=Streblomastix strix TaxID=222440 RepID=A0A5J4V235_9EUKA|nr:MAG: hypothetical protein EZS28_027673 [Streblomastix strix]KAA6376799.1 MAG: hypothetical protein EZS28_027674 [Streblomastix strix]KAA6376800.1 MAG: hypothetical protein EZS28_027675 [Streblomastix strix]
MDSFEIVSTLVDSSVVILVSDKKLKKSQIDSACDSGHSGHLGHMDISHHFSTIQIYGMNGVMAALFHRSPRICPVPKSVPH